MQAAGERELQYDMCMLTVWAVDRYPTRNFKPKAPVNPAVPYPKSEFPPKASGNQQFLF